MPVQRHLPWLTPKKLVKGEAVARRQLSQVIGMQGWVFDWWQANIGFFAAIQGQTNVMFIVLTMIVLVAAFNVVSSLVMLVRTKTADIAILRTMGATRGAIMRIFLLDGMAIGGIGTLLGLVLGLAFARWRRQPGNAAARLRIIQRESAERAGTGRLAADGRVERAARGGARAR